MLMKILTGFVFSALNFGLSQRFATTLHRLIASMVLPALLVAGCSGNAEYETVDFHETGPDVLRQAAPHAGPVLNVAVGAMISPEATITQYQALVRHIGEKTGLETRIIQRKTYSEVNKLVKTGKADIAFICTGPYILGKADAGFEAIATPVVRGEPFYRAYLIVHRDSPYESIADLAGGIFAFTDPDSNTGAMVPTRWVAALGHRPDAFFKRVHYTYSHDNSILAVASGLVDGASIDGHIWEYFQQADPVHTEQTRIIRKSEPFGSPPLVASAGIDEALKRRIQEAVVTMHEDPAGKRILDSLMIERFVTPEQEWYHSWETRAETDEKH